LPSQIILTIKQYLVNPSLLSHPSIESLGYSVVTAKLMDILSRGMKGYLTEKQSLQEQVLLLSQEMRNEKIKREEIEIELQRQNKENAGHQNNLTLQEQFYPQHQPSQLMNMSNMSMSRIGRGAGGLLDVSSSIHQTSVDERWTTASALAVGENDEKQYYLMQIKHLTQQIHDLKVQHKQEIDR
jgi:hypothetical protein